MTRQLIPGISKALAMARWRQTLVAAVGVTFSITMFIALLSFMEGLNSLLDGLVLNRTPHVRLFRDIKPSEQQPIAIARSLPGAHHFISSVKSGMSREEIRNSDAVIQTLRKDSRVVGYAPKLVTQVFFYDGNLDLPGVINGIDPVQEGWLFHFNDYVTTGTSIDIERIPNSIILGKGLAQRLLVEPGDVVRVKTPDGGRFPLKVVGYFQSGIGEVDKMQSYASIATVQKLTGKPSTYVTDIQIKLKDLEAAPAVAKEFAALFEADAEDIQTANAQFETGSSVRTLISYAVGITLLIVAGFGIYNILNMMIYEKMDSIAILKASGFSGRDVQKIFMLIAVGIGLVGGVLGLLFGFLLSMLISFIPFETPSLPTVTTYPVTYKPMFYIIGIAFSLITTYLAGWLPARKASRIDPVTIIRGK